MAGLAQNLSAVGEDMVIVYKSHFSEICKREKVMVGRFHVLVKRDLIC